MRARRLAAGVVLLLALGGLLVLVVGARDFGRTYGFAGSGAGIPFSGARGIPGFGLLGGIVLGLLLNLARSLAGLHRPPVGNLMLAAIVVVTVAYTVALAVGSVGR